MRCYLNILTQIMTKEELLDAQYFIADKTGRRTFYSDEFNYDPTSGTYNEVNNNDAIIKTSKYLVDYAIDTCSFSIATFLTKNAIDLDKVSKSRKAYDRYRAWLYQPQTMMSVYNNIISKIRADKLFIMIFMDEPTVRYAGDIACTYLANEFGQDITYIDPQYRPYVAGRVTYAGNKAHAEQVISDIRIKSLISGFMAAISNKNYESNDNNIVAYLSNLFTEVTDLIWFHNLLWPYDQLPPGNYTKADLLEIIVGKAMDDSQSTQQQRLSNLRIIDQNDSVFYDR